jgi:hypothetical protein
MIRRRRIAIVLQAAVFAASAVSAAAQGMPGERPFGPVGDSWHGSAGQGNDRWGGAGSDERYDRRADDEHGGGRAAQPSRKIAVTAFRAVDAGDQLGRGRIVVSRPASEAGDDTDGKLPVYEAAIVDELARRGYDTANANDPGQIAEIGVSHSVAVPEEAPHKPISGEMSTTISNRGSGFGLALAIDLSKPAKAIVATRLDLRIRDKATGHVLWEGHAEGEAREGDGGIDNGAMAARLASALLAKFPEGQVVQPLAAAQP